MKSLLIIRHAKSSWDITTLDDFNRPLNERGKKNAPKMAERLLKKHVNLDAFISSPAKRARKTACLFMKEYKRRKEDIILVPELYEAKTPAFYKVVEFLDESFSHVAIFSHNPGVTEFANSLTEVRIDDMPTCGVFAIKFSGKWVDFETAKKDFWFFKFPKLRNSE